MEEIGIKIKATDDASNTFGRVADEAARMQQSLGGAGNAGTIAMDRLGISAKQTAFALRQVPAQFTDIVVSLQGGQNPLTVLLQQGGQLKDLFGGIGPAARALGNYVAALVNPFTLAAGAAVALGVAYYQGSKEADAFSKALILTGNSAGATVGQMQAMAVSVSKATGATTGAAAEALAALAGSGTASSAQLEKFAATAIRLERDAGIAVADTVKQFSALAKDPVDASVKLNETTHFLTLRVYEQIKALEDQGRTADAAAKATGAYADAVIERAGKLEANLGSVERAWRGIVGGAKAAWDAMLDIGRAQSDDQKLNALKARLAEVQRLSASRPLVNKLGAAETNAEVASLQAQIAAITGVVSAKKQAADIDAATAKQVQAKIEFDKSGEEFRSKALKMEQEITKARTLGALAGESQAAIESRIVEIRKKYKETRNTDGDAYASIAAAIAKENDASTQALTLGRELTQSEKFRIDILGKLNEALRKKQITTAQSVALEADMLVAQTKRAAVERELAQIKANQANYNDQIRFQEEAAAGLVAESKAREQGRLAVDAYAKSISDANDLTAFELSIAGKTAQAREIALAQYRIELALKEQIKAIDGQAGFDEADRIEQRAKASAAAAAASSNVLAKSALDEWTKASDSINTSLTDALLNATDSGLGFFQSLAKDAENIFKKLVLRPVLSAALQPVANTVTSALGIGGQGGVGSLLSTAGSLGNAATGLGGLMGTNFGAGLSTGFQSLISGNIGGGLSTAAGLAETGALAGSLGTVAGLLGPVAIGIGLLSSLGGKFKSSGTTGNAGAVFDPNGQRASSYIVDATTAATEAVINGLQGNYAATAARLGIGTVATQFNYGGNTGAEGQSPNFALGGGALRSGSFYQGETKLSDEALSLASSRAIFAALQGSDLPKYLAGVFDNLDAGQLSQDQITNALNTASAFKALHDQLQDLPFAQLKDLSYTAAAGLAAVSGGLDKFQTNLASYYDKFYSDAEKTANTTASVTKALAGLGLAMPTLDENARTAYRALVDAQDVTTASGQQAYATLLSVGTAFDQIATAADNAAKAAADLKSAWQSTTDSIFDEVKRIRGLSGSSTATLANAQAQFAITSAQASAGDQAAAKLLPSLSQAMLTLAEASATSLTELRRIQGQTAASLSTTGTTLANRYGLTIPSFDVGTNLVPQDMLALIHKGEAIVPSAYNPAFGGAGNSNADLVARLDALTAQLAQVLVSSQDTATYTRKTAQTLVRVTRDGESMLTEVAT